MNIFKKLIEAFSGKKRNAVKQLHEEPLVVPTENKKEDEPVGYRVIVGMSMERIFGLPDEEVVTALNGKLDGLLYTGNFISERGPDTDSYAPCIRRFTLTKESDFEPFAQAMKTLNGVIGVKKGDGPWTNK